MSRVESSRVSTKDMSDCRQNYVGKGLRDVNRGSWFTSGPGRENHDKRAWRR